MPTPPVAGSSPSSLAYADRGQGGSGPALVLVHGFPLDSRIWEAQVAELSPRFRVITPDLPGFGKSSGLGQVPAAGGTADAGDGGFSIESLADTLHAFLAELKVLPCVLGGLSMGGYVSLAYAKKYPGDLRGLVLVDTKSEADTHEGKAGRDKMVALVRQSGSKAVAEQMEPKMLAADTPARRPQVAKALRSIMEACSPRTIERALLAMRERPDYTPSLGSIGVPTLVVVGDADAITPPAVAEAMARRIPSSQVVVIRGAGHLSPMEQPAQVSQALRQFMDSRLGNSSLCP